MVTLLTGYKRLLVIASFRKLVVSQTRSLDQTGVLDMEFIEGEFFFSWQQRSTRCSYSQVEGGACMARRQGVLYAYHWPFHQLGLNPGVLRSAGYQRGRLSIAER